MGCQDCDSFSLPVRHRVEILSRTSKSMSDKNGSKAFCPAAVARSGMGRFCISGVMRDKFRMALSGAAMPQARAFNRSCMVMAGISPSTYKTLLGLLARQLYRLSPPATAKDMLSAVNVLPIPRGAYKITMPWVGITVQAKSPVQASP